MTREQLGRGLNACIASGDDWPPTLPAFKRMCLGIPKESAAKAAVLGRAPEVDPRFAALMNQYLDLWRIRNLDAGKTEKLLHEAYERACDHLMNGGELPEIKGALRHQPPDPAEEHRQAMERMRVMGEEMRRRQSAQEPADG